MSQDWLRVPVGRDAADWRTVATERTVLAVVHTVASAEHVLDAIELLEPDRRVQIVFTQAPDLFGNGVQDHLRALGAVTIGWHQATQTDFDLVVAADCAVVHELHGPLLAISHGVPNNKLAPPPLGGPASGLVVGASAPWLTWYGRLLPAALAVSHRDVLAVLTRQCPQALPVATVTGDLCLDRLAESLPHRARYRRALGVDDARTVVAVSSTWGVESLLGRSSTLFGLLSGLPSETFSVNVVVHPAAWFAHGPRQILGWLRQHRHDGVRVVDPASWRGLVAAADVLIGDHGSATIYAAAAGVPVRLAGPPSLATAPGSAAEVLVALEADRPLAAQLRAAVDLARHRAHASIADAVTSEPGRAAELLRAQMYRLLALSEPEYGCTPAPVGLPVPVDQKEHP